MPAASCDLRCAVSSRSSSAVDSPPAMADSSWLYDSDATPAHRRYSPCSVTSSQDAHHTRVLTQRECTRSMRNPSHRIDLVEQGPPVVHALLADCEVVEARAAQLDVFEELDHDRRTQRLAVHSNVESDSPRRSAGLCSGAGLRVRIRRDRRRPQQPRSPQQLPAACLGSATRPAWARFARNRAHRERGARAYCQVRCQGHCSGGRGDHRSGEAQKSLTPPTRTGGRQERLLAQRWLGCRTLLETGRARCSSLLDGVGGEGARRA